MLCDFTRISGKYKGLPCLNSTCKKSDQLCSRHYKVRQLMYDQNRCHYNNYVLGFVKIEEYNGKGRDLSKCNIIVKSFNEALNLDDDVYPIIKCDVYNLNGIIGYKFVCTWCSHNMTEKKKKWHYHGGGEITEQNSLDSARTTGGGSRCAHCISSSFNIHGYIIVGEHYEQD